MGYHSNFNFGCNTERCSIESLSKALGLHKMIELASKTFRPIQALDLHREKTVSRENFHVINNSFVDALLLEAVELDDLDSIEGILSWRNVKARKYKEFPGLPITFDQFFVVVAKGSDVGVLKFRRSRNKMGSFRVR